MVTRPSTADFIVGQVGGAGRVIARKMFGEYGLYCDGKLVGLLCDERLFVKPTAEGRTYLGAVTEASPYPGAKPFFLIAGEAWEDADWLTELIKLSAAALPIPTSKKPKPKRGKQTP